MVVTAAITASTQIALHPGDVLNTYIDPSLTRTYTVVGPGEDPANIVLVDVTDTRNPTMALQQLSHVIGAIRGGFTTVNGWKLKT